MRDGEEIYQMVDQKLKSGNFKKRGTPAESFPRNSVVIDECAEETDDGDCDNDKSDWKYVILDFYNLDVDSLHKNYTVKNVFGESEPIKLIEIVDGNWGSWSQWSACSKQCISKNDQGIEHFMK